MKIKKNKYIRLTEQQLHNIIQETVQKELALLQEYYSVERKKFKILVWSLMPQIIQNWCLVHYCTLINEDVNQCKNHWQNEYIAHLDNIANTTIKGNNSKESRFKALVEVCCNEMEYDSNVKKIARITNRKFTNEGIDISSEIVKQTYQDCAENIKHILETLVEETYDEYIKQI